jgi:outer membrane protein assembly factor BamB
LITCTVEWPADAKERKAVMPDHFVTCYSTADGKQLWQTSIKPGPWLRDDFRSGPGGGYAAPTPCSDGEHVFVVFGSSVMASLDLEGKIAWRKEITPFTFDVTIGTSPILYGKHVIFVCMMAKKSDSRIAAFDQATGELAWEVKTNLGFGHSTPVIIEAKNRRQMLVAAGAMGNAGDAMQSFDPENGKRLWWCKGGGEASSPAFMTLHDGSPIVFFDSGRGGSGTAVDPTGEGDVSKSHIKWTTGNYGEAISSPIISRDGYVYRLVSGSVLKCWNAKTGEPVYSERLPVTSTWASPIADGFELLYFASAGKSAVVQTGPEFKLVATNDLGDGNHASPAASGGKLFFVGLKQVWCVGKK